MNKILITTEKEIPVIKYTGCANCNLPCGKREKNVPKRGCCWYDVELDLYDIKNIIDRDKSIFIDIISKHPYIIDADLNVIYFSANKINNNENRENKVCIFFEKDKGCSLPVYARPFICRVTLCPHLRKYIDTKEYIKIKQVNNLIYRHRIKYLDLLNRELYERGIEMNKIDLIIEILESLPKLKPLEIQNAEVYVKSNCLI
ncbi:hypothetical protein [Alkaliphilus sp. B6464]|uniref:hypothetical protein n=1 Tax=Alkaliphilus sp. B6464 TaxID=2731219 RepID=UPI001BA59F01|nr:hypothetical protein [Alkaliphilus sp. B6464]QUH21976.1 hypothetical protein HYG84_18905 [Alkaliphilus sp. B6464]